ncbi:MAG: GNAT family N-acetyltransferase, partial [Calditrichaeota bacterium]|nr:GNAT family N-acetyltransferase [Calditrichota bacterium]
HALPIEALLAPGMSVWSVWLGDSLAGCGALRELDRTHGEVKSMRTAPEFLRRGVARALMDHIMAVARGRGYQRLSLETGAMAAFEPARALYRRLGFVDCAPFGEYHEDRNSVFMTREID